MFDEQIQKIINFIDKEIVSLRKHRPDIELVSFEALSRTIYS